MVLLQIVDFANTEGNGVAVAVSKYIEYERLDCKVAIYNLKASICKNYEECFCFPEFPNISLLPYPYNKPDLVIFNEVYKINYIRLYKECIDNNIPYIIIPHGCLVTEAQKQKRVKKRIGNILLFNRFINSANAIQFLNEGEKRDSKFKYRNCIICGNGTDNQLYKNNPKNNDLIYIGRYSINHKGLDLLAQTVKENKDWFIDKNVKLQLYGRDSGNDLEKLSRLIKKWDISNILILNGSVYSNNKRLVLENSYAFIQCSRYEGQSMGIIEALAIGAPCIVTKATYMGEYILDNKCGLVVDFNTRSLMSAIKNIYSDKDLRDNMSKNAYIKSNLDFNWGTVIKNTIKEYKGLI